MVASHSLPSPPAEENGKVGPPRRNTTSGIKPAKPPAASRVSKRAVSSAGFVYPYEQTQGSAIAMDGRHRRVWKACERCRMKKTKCDGEFPCKRCKDDGMVCTAGARKKVEYKQLPKGYAEVLENTQFALIATVHKLYSMVRNSQPWELGEPELNDRGEPVIHNIAQRLGCIRPLNDLDLPVHHVFPEDEAGMAALTRQLEEQQQQQQQHEQEQHREQHKEEHRENQQQQRRRQERFRVQLQSAPRLQQPHHETEDPMDVCIKDEYQTDNSSSDLDADDSDRRTAFDTASSLGLSPPSYRTDSNPGLDFGQPSRGDGHTSGYPFPSHLAAGFLSPGNAAWSLPGVHRSAVMTSYLQNPYLHSMGMFPPPVGDGDSTTIKPAILSTPNASGMLGMLHRTVGENDYTAVKPAIMTSPTPHGMLGTDDPMLFESDELKRL